MGSWSNGKTLTFACEKLLVRIQPSPLMLPVGTVYDKNEVEDRMVAKISVDKIPDKGEEILVTDDENFILGSVIEVKEDYVLLQVLGKESFDEYFDKRFKY